MMRRATCLGLAVVSYGAAIALPHAAPATTPVTLAERALRPFVLPSLWSRLSDATRRGDPAEAIAAGRLIAHLLPRWTDGLVHVAWICALDLSLEAGTTTAALERLQLGLGWLVEAADTRGSAGDRQAAAELWLAAATLLEARTTADPAVAAAYRTRLGDDPSVAVVEFVARAAEAVPDPAFRTRHGFVTARLVVGAVLMGDLARATRTLPTAIRTLEATGDPDAQAYARALRSLRPLETYVDDPVARRALLDDPWLAELGEALGPDRN